MLQDPAEHSCVAQVHAVEDRCTMIQDQNHNVQEEDPISVDHDHELSDQTVTQMLKQGPRL